MSKEHGWALKQFRHRPTVRNVYLSEQVAELLRSWMAARGIPYSRESVRQTVEELVKQQAQEADYGTGHHGV